MDTLKYHLIENLLTADPSDCRAVTEGSGSYTFNDVVEEMLKRGTLLTRTDITAVFDLFHIVTDDLVKQGYSINLPICNGSPSISGVFTGPDDAFDPSRHFVKYNLNPGTLIRDALSKIKVEKTDPVDKSPYIERFNDVVSQTSDDVLTPKGIGELIGSRISFDAADEEQGLYFIATDGSENKVTTIALNKPSKLIFMIPALAAGEYDVVVRLKYLNSKTLRSNQYKKKLTVTG